MTQFLTGGMLWILFLLTYLIVAYPIFVMGQKTDSDHAWFAFVPILNAVLLLEIAGKDLWWILLFLIPCVNIIVAIVVWMGVAEAMDKPAWVGVLVILPLVGWLVPWYLAFG